MLVYALAVEEIYPNGNLSKVGTWFLRSN